MLVVAPDEELNRVMPYPYKRQVRGRLWQKGVIMKRLESTIQQAMEKGQKYRVSNERLYDICCEAEEYLLDIAKETFIDRTDNKTEWGVRIAVSDHKYKNYRIDTEGNTVYVGGEVITYDGYLYGRRKERIEFLRDFPKIVEALENIIEEEEKEITAVLDNFDIPKAE